MHWLHQCFFLKDQLHHSYPANGPNDFALSEIRISRFHTSTVWWNLQGALTLISKLNGSTFVLIEVDLSNETCLRRGIATMVSGGKWLTGMSGDHIFWHCSLPFPQMDQKGHCNPKFQTRSGSQQIWTWSEWSGHLLWYEDSQYRMEVGIKGHLQHCTRKACIDEGWMDGTKFFFSFRFFHGKQMTQLIW